MLTYSREDKILFPCDLFGSHLATTDLYVADEGQVYEAAKRYFAEIMMPFRTSIEKHLEKLNNFKIDIIAPSHGPLHNKPSFITEAYRTWVSGPPRNIVVLPYISMHGSTQKIVEHFVGALVDKSVTVKQFNLEATDIGKLAMALVDAATMVIGTPTVLVGPHPNIAHAAFLANALRPRLQFISIIGSYGWGSKAVEQLTGMVPNLKAEVLDPVIIKGFPREEDFKALDNLASTIAKKHKEHGFA
jgi:flavorubredoxin